MTFGLLLRQIVRDLRGQGARLVFFLVCLGTGVGAVVAVAGFSRGLENGIRDRARQLLAADAAISSLRKLTPTLENTVAGLPKDVEVARTFELVTMITAGSSTAAAGEAMLVELKALEGRYPFYGTITLAPERPLTELLTKDTAVVAPEVLSRLGLRVGEDLAIGGERFRIAATIAAEPDRIGGTFTLGPRIFVTKEGLDRTSLESFGSRVVRKTLFKLPPAGTREDLERLVATLKAASNGVLEYRIETYAESQANLRDGIARVDKYLGLVALLSLLVGGVGIAQTVRAWLAGRLDSLAVLACLGFRPREVLALFLSETLLLALAGSLAGAAFGTAVLGVLPLFLGDLVPAGWVSAWQPAGVLRGVLLGLALAAVFSLPTLLAAGRVPPARVLRRDTEPLPLSRLSISVVLTLLFAGVFGTALVQARSALLALQFTLALLAVALLLAGVAALLLNGLARIPRERLSYRLRHPLAALAHPGSGTLGSIVALGIGVLVVLTLALVERSLSSQLRSDLPKDAPTLFLIDVQPDQWAGAEKELRAAGATRIDSVPVVMARLKALDGQPVEKLAEGAKENKQWTLTREQRLTYVDKLADDNEIVAGQALGAHGATAKTLFVKPDVAELSLERDFAKDLGAKVGSVLTFDVQGVPLDLTVTSIRAVNWKTFGINFFFVVEPGVLEDAPQTRLAAARVPPEREDALRSALARSFPNVTLVPVREVLEKIAALLGRLGGAVRFLGGFTVLAGVVILAGAVGATSSRRGREVALLKTIGLSRASVSGIFAAEYALVGLVAAGIAIVSAVTLSHAIAVEVFDLPPAGTAGPVLVAALSTVFVAVAAGLLASLGALRRRPIEALRSE
ncbi:MAG: ABC transporter permease [Acidobacteria bacterium]|nr:ABC transporter permease [Acidobacteriota bacterium]